ncbi:unnamed protein product [Urochloa humidicola]
MILIAMALRWSARWWASAPRSSPSGSSRDESSVIRCAAGDYLRRCSGVDSLGNTKQRVIYIFLVLDGVSLLELTKVSLSSLLLMFKSVSRS